MRLSGIYFFGQKINSGQLSRYAVTKHTAANAWRFIQPYNAPQRRCVLLRHKHIEYTVMTPTDKSELLAKLAKLAADSHHADIEPTARQLHALVAADAEGPWHFMNLLAFHDEAQYPADHELSGKGFTGEAAYNKYGKVAFEHVTKRGGKLITLNTVHQAVIGTQENWSRMATMEYPSIDAFLDMIQDPEYRAAMVHRDAGLKETIVLATKPI